MRDICEMERIVHIYGDLLLRYAMNHMAAMDQAEDMVQDIFIRYMKKAPIFENEQHERAWLLRVASNMIKDHHKSWWQTHTGILQDNAFEKQEDNYAYVLLPYVRRLSRKSRDAIFLYYYESLSIREIAEIYDTKEMTVESWLYRGRKHLKKMLEGADWNELEGL